MTIRYTCQDCASVLKIRDELAGTRAKCPKCKTRFQIPPKRSSSKRKSRLPPEESFNNLEDLVDMPLEVTPAAHQSSSGEFDPMSVLFAPSSDSGDSSRPAVPVDDADKPSIAELMKEHEAKKKKKSDRRSKKNRKGSVEEAAAAVNAFTSGSAADALARTYDSKRESASEPQPMTREEKRAAEYRAVARAFAIKAGVGLGVFAIIAFFGFKWYFSAALPDLADVSGVVQLKGAPLAGVEVQFMRVRGPDDGKVENATTSTASTAKDGSYVMMYDHEHEGVLPGTHKIRIVNAYGRTFHLPSQYDETKVVLDEDNVINIDLQ